MKTAKSKVQGVLIAILFIVTMIGTTIYYSSCKKDPCSGITCLNGGTSVSSGDNCNCDCPVGYEGDRCQSKTIDKLLGYYDSSSITGRVIISPANSFEDRITCSIDCNNSFYASVSGNTITIPIQNFCSTFMSISGSGTINSTGSNLTIKLNLILTGSYSCCNVAQGQYSITWTKL